MSYMACRTCLRDILARYLRDTAPSRIVFSKTANGKPVLANPNERLFFNVAHTVDTALIAVSSTVAVGIDVELSSRRVRNVSSLMRRCCTEQERKVLIEKSRDGAGKISQTRLMRNFVKLWTCKEAFVKCTGEGISRGLATFEVEEDEEIYRIASVSGDRKAAGKWSVYQFQADLDHFATIVAATGKQLELHQIDWNSTNEECCRT